MVHIDNGPIWIHGPFLATFQIVQIAQEESNSRVVSGLFTNSPLQKTVPLVVLFGDILGRPTDSLFLYHVKLAAKCHWAVL